MEEGEVEGTAEAAVEAEQSDATSFTLAKADAKVDVGKLSAAQFDPFLDAWLRHSARGLGAENEQEYLVKVLDERMAHVYPLLPEVHVAWSYSVYLAQHAASVDVKTALASSFGLFNGQERIPAGAPIIDYISSSTVNPVAAPAPPRPHCTFGCGCGCRQACTQYVVARGRGRRVGHWQKVEAAEIHGRQGRCAIRGGHALRESRSTHNARTVCPSSLEVPTHPPQTISQLLGS